METNKEWERKKKEPRKTIAKNRPKEREKEREKMLSPLKTNPFEQTARSSGSNFPIMPSFDRVSRGYTKKKKKKTRVHTPTHTEERKARRRGKKNSFWNGAAHGDATRRTLVSWFVVAPVNSGWLPASCKRTGRDPGWSARREKEEGERRGRKKVVRAYLSS